MANKLNILILAAIILLCIPAYAQYETLAGISTDSPEYNQYKSCVDSCGQCEQNCKANTYRMAAEMQGNEEMCKQLPEAEQQMCLNRAYSMKAVSSKNSAECQKISEEGEKNSCILNVQTEKAIASESEAECNSAPETMVEICRQSFYQRMAMQKADETYCNKITDEMLRRMCAENVAMQKGAAAPITETRTEETGSESSGIKSKSLIIYGIIILGVIIAAVAAIIVIKKVTGKKPAQAPPLVVQQQTSPPLNVQQQPQQGMQQSVPQIQGEKR
ncbi:MAG: hypothetical protein PHO02_04735 [Candidatus Nanoarchaeia archaeon]|nr:hypothetical protein [Candidatus Nanoarchaeia archaeon]